MNNYYLDELSAHRLRRCYEIAPPRVRQYLRAEVNHVLQKIGANSFVLELGCGYGRVLQQLAKKARFVIGIDTSLPSLMLARKMLENISNCVLLNMNAIQLAFSDRTFDCVVCIQNGISAFHIDQKSLIQEGVRVTKPGGITLFSSYSDKFWKNRLEWFQLQSGAGLLGEIDWDKTSNGVIVCKDGFTATTVRRREFQKLISDLNVDKIIEEVDESSIFLEIRKQKSK